MFDDVELLPQVIQKSRTVFGKVDMSESQSHAIACPTGSYF
jgi:hypothetical protein